MSYCRWSSDDWMCDCYVYQDVAGGYTIHVAARRRIRRPQPAVDESSPERFAETFMAQMKDVESIPLEAIGMPHDGATYRLSSLPELRDTLLMLQAAGYNVPAWVLEDIGEEIAAND